MTMRSFRDNYVRFLPDGENTIAEYYRIAPPIVDVINSKSDKDSIYKAIYERLKMRVVCKGRKKRRGIYRVYKYDIRSQK